MPTYGDHDVRSLLMHGILPVIRDAHKDRNRIERMFNRLKQFRRIAKRYDKTATSFIGFLPCREAPAATPRQ